VHAIAHQTCHNLIIDSNSKFGQLVGTRVSFQQGVSKMNVSVPRMHRSNE